MSVVVHASSTRAECGCRLPGGPCPELRRLKAERDAAYSDVLDASGDLDAATDAYGKREARSRLESAEAAHEEARRRYMEHHLEASKPKKKPPGE